MSAHTAAPPIVDPPRAVRMRRVVAAVLVVATVLVTVALLAAAAPSDAGAASGSTRWIYTIDSGPGQYDWVEALIPGPAGSAYVAGNYDHHYNDSGVAFTARFLPTTGATPSPLSWQQSWNSPLWTDAAYALATDRSGNVISAGMTLQPVGDRDWLVLKRSPAGSLLWSAQYDGGLGLFDYAYAVGTDAAGNPYVAGSSTVAPGQSDLVVRKYSADGGALVWSYSYHWPATPQGTNEASTIAVAADGTSYIGGRAQTGSGEKTVRGVILKLSPTGKRVWLRTVKSSTAVSSSVWHLVLRGRALYADGVAFRGAADTQPFVARYSTGGKLGWLRSFRGVKGSTTVRSRAFVVDGLGNPTLGGWTQIRQEAAKAFVVSWTPSGVKRWVRTYVLMSAPQPYASVEALVSDGRGNLWAAGRVITPGASDNALLLRLSPAGRIVWVRRIDRGGLGEDFFRSVTLWGNNGVLAGGASASPVGDYDMFLVNFRR